MLIALLQRLVQFLFKLKVFDRISVTCTDYALNDAYVLIFVSLNKANGIGNEFCQCHYAVA